MEKYNIDIVGKSNTLVFDANEACALREKKHISGHLIGSLANSARQNVFFGMPLLISNEETKLLESLQVADILERFPNINLNGSFLTDIKEKHKNYLREFHLRQIETYKQKRLIELGSLKDKILSGKFKKIQSKIDALNKDGSLSDAKKAEEISKLQMELNTLESTFVKEQEDKLEKELKPDSCTIQFNIELNVKTLEHLICTSNTLICNQKFLSLTPELDYKFCIYEYLWLKGFYLTSGAKFGGDYLVYSGDPLRYHSSFILLCIRNKREYEAIKLRQLIAFGRLATNVKKTFLIAFYDSNEKYFKRILFTCINWAHL